MDGKDIIKNLSGKNSQKTIDCAKKSATDAPICTNTYRYIQTTN